MELVRFLDIADLINTLNKGEWDVQALRLDKLQQQLALQDQHESWDWRFMDEHSFHSVGFAADTATVCLMRRDSSTVSSSFRLPPDIRCSVDFDEGGQPMFVLIGDLLLFCPRGKHPFSNKQNSRLLERLTQPFVGRRFLGVSFAPIDRDPQNGLQLLLRFEDGDLAIRACPDQECYVTLDVQGSGLVLE